MTSRVAILSLCVVVIGSLVRAGDDEEFIAKRHARNLTTSTDRDAIGKATQYLMRSPKGRQDMVDAMAARKGLNAVKLFLLGPPILSLAEQTKSGEPYVPQLTGLVIEYMKTLKLSGDSQRARLTTCMNFFSQAGSEYARDALPLLRHYEESEDTEFANLARRVGREIERKAK